MRNWNGLVPINKVCVCLIKHKSVCPFKKQCVSVVCGAAAAPGPGSAGAREPGELGWLGPGTGSTWGGPALGQNQPLHQHPRFHHCFLHPLHCRPVLVILRECLCSPWPFVCSQSTNKEMFLACYGIMFWMKFCGSKIPECCHFAAHTNIWWQTLLLHLDDVLHLNARWWPHPGQAAQDGVQQIRQSCLLLWGLQPMASGLSPHCIHQQQRTKFFLSFFFFLAP